jgi:hypothetical protein
MLNIDCLCSTCQVCQITNKEHTRKKYGHLPPKKGESDSVTLGHGLCRSGESIYNKDTITIQNTLSACTHNDRSSNQPPVGFEIVKATNKSATFIQDLFHNTWSARYPRPQLVVFDNGNVGEFKREFKQMCDNYGI